MFKSTMVTCNLLKSGEKGHRYILLFRNGVQHTIVKLDSNRKGALMGERLLKGLSYEVFVFLSKELVGTFNLRWWPGKDRGCEPNVFQWIWRLLVIGLLQSWMGSVNSILLDSGCLLVEFVLYTFSYDWRILDYCRSVDLLRVCDLIWAWLWQVNPSTGKLK